MSACVLFTLKGILVLTVETKTPILSLLWSTLYELQLSSGTPENTRKFEQLT